MTSLAALFEGYVTTAPHAPAIHHGFGATRKADLSRAELLAGCRALAAYCVSRGVEPGDRVLIALDDPTEFVIAFWATQLCGAVAAPVKSASEADLSNGASARIARCISVAGARLSITNARDVSAWNMCGFQAIAATGLEAAAGDRFQATLAPAEGLAVIQFTSGSLSEPKACGLSHEAVLNNARALAAFTGAAPLDASVVWLPLHHDMGLMSGVIVPVASGASTCLLTPSRFMTNPLSWLQGLGSFPRTHTAAPNFSLALVLQRLERRTPVSLDLSGVQSFLCGAEQIDADLADRFFQALAPFGLREKAFRASYGMAETTVFACGKEGGIWADRIDPAILAETGTAAPAEPGRPFRRVVNVGSPPAAGGFRIVDKRRAIVADRRVGQIELKSNSMMSGYLHAASATAAAFSGEWLRTGDLGYAVDGELFVTGRFKDLIIVGGRNIEPVEIERQVARACALPQLRVAAFGRAGELGTEEICILIESRDRDTADLEAKARRACLRACGVAPSIVTVGSPGAIPRTSSGKVRRALLRDRASGSMSETKSGSAALDQPDDRHLASSGALA
jgi:acyl-CoA synthetase (AMP-forming)/AMP-acid ligase II